MSVKRMELNALISLVFQHNHWAIVQVRSVVME